MNDFEDVIGEENTGNSKKRRLKYELYDSRFHKSYDNITYRNTYYLAEFLGNVDEIKITPENKEQYTEVSDIQFFKIEKALEYIRDYIKNQPNHRNCFW